MKITQLNLISFGKFKNTRISLPEKCVVSGGNEAGKSTVAAFIRIMLYGPSRSGDRRRYIPWDGEVMEGEMTLEIDGREYLLHRTAGASAKNDRFGVLSLSDGKMLSALPQPLCDEAVFRRTVFMAQQASVFDKGADLGETLRGALLGDGVRAEAALSALAERRRLLTNPRGKYKGRLDIARDRLDELLRRENAAEAERARAQQLKLRLSAAETEYSAAADALARCALQPKAAAPADALGEKRRAPMWVRVLFIALLMLFAASSAVLAAKYTLLRGGLFFAVSELLTATVYFICNRCGVFEVCGRSDARADSEYRISEAGETAAEAERSARLRLDRASAEMYGLRAEIDAAKSAVSVREEISAAREEVALLEARLRDIDAADAGIRAALARISESWLPLLNEKISAAASEILGRRLEIYADAELNLTVREETPHGADAYSGGARDQLYLALRLAAAEVCFPSDAPPLILDEPFLQYDAEREEKTIDILLETSNENQIIIFSCKNPIVFKNKGFEILTI